MSLAPGTRLGPYEILAPIGAGGMGEVFRARDTRLDRVVAIKILPEHLSSRPQLRERFEREARAVSSLNHPHICTLHDLGCQDGVDFVVMEYLEGETLAQRLKKGQLPSEQVLEYAIQITDALDTAHRHGVIHRDVKPANIMLTKNGAKLLDFGLAKMRRVGAVVDQSQLPTEVAPLTGEGMILGTLQYMAPEQLEGKEADVRTDLFALGAVIYEMARGRKAFEGSSQASLISAIMSSEPPSISTLQSMSPPALDHVVRTCLAKDPDARWQSAHDVLVDLKWIVAAGSQAGISKPVVARWKRRELVLLALAAVSLAVGYLVHPRTYSLPVPPHFRRITFLEGTVSSGLFTPDGHSIIFNAMLDRPVYRSYIQGLDSTEARDLGLPDKSVVVAVSSKGELAIFLDFDEGNYYRPYELARRPVSGGAVREVLENVESADWSPDGQSLAVARKAGLSYRVEYPIGQLLDEGPEGDVATMRVSPDGDSVAFLVSSRRSVVLKVITRSKAVRLATPLEGDSGSSGGLAWSPDGKEIWIRSWATEGMGTTLAVNFSGRTRVLIRTPQASMLTDVARDGRALLASYQFRTGILCHQAAAAGVKDLSWLDYSWVSDISADGKYLVVTQRGQGEGPGPGVYLRRTDGSPAARLGDGVGGALSPDGKWVSVSRSKRQSVLIPTGAGEEKTITIAALEGSSGTVTAWLPDGLSYVIVGNEVGKQRRLFIWNSSTGALRAITPEGSHWPLLSPDGRKLLYRAAGEEWYWTSVAGGETHAVQSLKATDLPLRWHVDGQSVFVANPIEGPVIRIYLLNLQTSKRTLWNEVQVATRDQAVTNPLITPDGKSYAYQNRRSSSDIYLVEGLK